MIDKRTELQLHDWRENRLMLGEVLEPAMQQVLEGVI